MILLRIPTAVQPMTGIEFYFHFKFFISKFSFQVITDRAVFQKARFVRNWILQIFFLHEIKENGILSKNTTFQVLLNILTEDCEYKQCRKRLNLNFRSSLAHCNHY